LLAYHKRFGDETSGEIELRGDSKIVQGGDSGLDFTLQDVIVRRRKSRDVDAGFPCRSIHIAAASLPAKEEWVVALDEEAKRIKEEAKRAGWKRFAAQALNRRMKRMKRMKSGRIFELRIVCAEDLKDPLPSPMKKKAQRVWREGDHVKIVKTGTQIGKTGVVSGPDWAGQVKILMDDGQGCDGATRSYLKQGELVQYQDPDRILGKSSTNAYMRVLWGRTVPPTTVGLDRSCWCPWRPPNESESTAWRPEMVVGFNIAYGEVRLWTTRLRRTVLAKLPKSQIRTTPCTRSSKVVFVAHGTRPPRSLRNTRKRDKTK
jgi:hypothetical protein